MDLTTILAMLFLALGGVALDAYQHPRTLTVDIINRSDDTGAGLDKGIVAGVVHHELDHMARVSSLLARPHIRPSEEKGFVEALGDATGTTAFMNVIASEFQAPPDTINLGIYQDGGKLKAYVYGAAGAVPSRDGRYNVLVTQEDGEIPIDTVRRATVAGAARIDPYLTMLYLLGELDAHSDEHYATAALAVSSYMEARVPPDVTMVLLARMENTKGLVHLRLGHLDEASTAFADGLRHLSPGDNGATTVILRLNKAFVDLARGDTDSAQAQLAKVDATTNHFQGLIGARVSSTEDTEFRLRPEEVGFLASAGNTIAAGIALRRKQLDQAQSLLKQVLQKDPHQLLAMSMLADVEAIRGHTEAEHALRKAVVEQSLTGSAYVELAFAHGALSFAADTVTLTRSLYVMR